MPKDPPASPTSGPDPASPATPATVPCPPQKSISGLFTETEAKCGDPGHVEATGVLISEGANTDFSIYRVRGNEALKSVAAPMNGQRVAALAWEPIKPAGMLAADRFEFTVSADGVQATSSNQFRFIVPPDAAAETKTFNCASGRFGWTGKFDIAYAADVVTVTVKIKLINRLGAKPAAGAALPAIGSAVTDADKLAMKTDVEGKLSEKVVLYRTACRLGASCTCTKPIKIVVSFVESGQHHDVNLFQGPGRANASNWTRVKTRANSWAHETGHLIAWYDEYTGGAVGTTPRWKANEPANVMNVGLTVPPEYTWDFRDWFIGKAGENYTAK